MSDDSGLMSEDFKDGKGILFIGMEGTGDKAKFTVTDEAKAFLETLKAPIALASIVGRYRTGKSFLVNRMLLDVVGKGFMVGATVNSCTKGLWIWNKPLKCKMQDGTEVNLLIIDTEGIGSLDADADHDAKIFALALLLSSYFIYNSVGSIDESALNNLSLVVELTKHIRTKAGGGAETGENFAQFFPHFLWVVRDFALQLCDEGGRPITSRQYLEKALTPTAAFSDTAEVKNKIRRMLLAFFPDRDCVTLKRPIEDEGKLQELDSVDWGDLRPEFVKQVKQLRQKIYTSSPPKMLNGKSLDGSMIGWLAEAYSQGINEGEKLNIGDAWAQVSRSKNQQAADGAIQHYERLVSKLTKEDLPIGSKELDEKHGEMSAAAMKHLRANSIGEDIDQYIEAAAEKIGEMYRDLRRLNDEVAREGAMAKCKEAYEELEEGVGAGIYPTIKAYEAERSKVRAVLVETLPETGAKSEVIASFMEGRLSAAALSIEGKLALEMEDERAQMREAAKVAAHESDQLRLRLEKETGELLLKEQHALKQKEELEGRMGEAKQQLEEEREAAKAKVQEVTSRYEEQVMRLKVRMEEEERDNKEALRRQRERADEAESSMVTKVALITREKEYSENRVAELERSKGDLESMHDKDKRTIRGLQEELEEAQKAAASEKARAREAEKRADGGQEESLRQHKQKEREWNKQVEELKRQLEEAIAAGASNMGMSEEEAARVAANLDRERERAEKEAARSASLDVALAESKHVVMRLEAERDAAKRDAFEERRKGEGDAKAEFEKEKAAMAEAHAKALAAAEERADKAMSRNFDVAREAGMQEGMMKALQMRVSEVEGKLREKTEEAVVLERRIRETEERARSAAALHAEASAEVLQVKTQMDAMHKFGSKTKPEDTAELTQVLEKQARMKESFHEEIRRLSLETEKQRIIVEKLTKKCLQASLPIDDVHELRVDRSKMMGSPGVGVLGRIMGGGTPTRVPPEASVLQANGSNTGSDSARERAKNEIVFKPHAATETVYDQVAKQTNRSKDEVMRAHENAKRDGNSGVAAAAVGSGEKFSFAKLRQTISKKVSLAIHNVDGALDMVDSRISNSGSRSTNSPAVGGGGQRAPSSSPPLPSVGSFPIQQGYPADDEASGQHRVPTTPAIYDYKKGFTPSGAPALHMQSPTKYNTPGR